MFVNNETKKRGIPENYNHLVKSFMFTNMIISYHVFTGKSQNTQNQIIPGSYILYWTQNHDPNTENFNFGNRKSHKKSLVINDFTTKKDTNQS